MPSANAVGKSQQLPSANSADKRKKKNIPPTPLLAGGSTPTTDERITPEAADAMKRVDELVTLKKAAKAAGWTKAEIEQLDSMHAERGFYAVCQFITKGYKPATPTKQKKIDGSTKFDNVIDLADRAKAAGWTTNQIRKPLQELYSKFGYDYVLDMITQGEKPKDEQ